MVHAVLQAHPGKQHPNSLLDVFLALSADTTSYQLIEDLHGELDILVGRHGCDEVECLKDEANLLQSEFA